MRAGRKTGDSGHNDYTLGQEAPVIVALRWQSGIVWLQTGQIDG